MATLKGLIDFEGTIGGISAYTRNGERVIRQKSSVSKKKMMRGKNYERTRENMSEFGGGVTASKILRQSIASISRGFTDTNFTGRLQGKYRDMISLAPGKRGQRVFKPLAHAAALLAIPFDMKFHLDSVLRVQPVITVNAARTAATLSIAGFNPFTDLFASPGATHVELIYAIAVQPAFEYDAHTKKYKRTDGLDHHYMKTVSSGVIPLTDEAMDLSLPVSPLDLDSLYEESALVSVLGIRFHQQTGFKTYPLETGKAMGFVSLR